MSDSARGSLTEFLPDQESRSDSRLGEALRKRREEIGLSQAQAAIDIGVTERTLRRWESTGIVSKLRDREQIELRYGKRFPWPDNLPDVSRGTVVRERAPDPYRARNDRIANFEREMVRLGADDFEADLSRALAAEFVDALGRPAPEGEAPLDPDAELEFFLNNGLRPWVARRIQLRAASSQESLPGGAKFEADHVRPAERPSTKKRQSSGE
jgi:transcriptional regulator with XRE-family HTH domain